MAHARTRRIAGGVLGCAVLVCLVAGLEAQPAGRKAFTFRGVVENVDALSRSVLVNHEAVDGWMGAMTMSFRVEPADVLGQLKPGDRIVATVYGGDTGTIYGVSIAPSAGGPADELPPVSYVCRSPGEETFLSDEPGVCPGSGAPLVPVRFVTAYSCLRVQLYIDEKPGTCRIDRTPLVPITAAVHFSCQDDPRVYEVDPGVCADGRPRVKVFERQPHGDHNPRHGGPYVAMSADQWHHLEATVVAPGRVRVYFYDSLTRPMRVTGMAGSVAPADENAHVTGPAVPLVEGRSADGSVLEAPVTVTAFPVRVKIAVQFKAGDREQLFDFTFQDYSREP